MLLPPAENNKLSADNYIRLEVFFRNFCEGSLRRQYGLGHLIYACHAAFPVVLTPELANLIWVNFKYFPYQDGTTENIHSIAVTDFILSPLCQTIGYQQYEVIPQIRSYLLHLLNDGSWFLRYGIALNGTERLNELAEFLGQFVKQKKPTISQKSTDFIRLNEWAALAYSNPMELAGRIGEVLQTYSRNNQGQLWLNTQMERFDKQFSYNIHRHSGNKEMLRPFLNLYHYTQARKSELFNKSIGQIARNALEIQSIPTSDGKGRVISMPLSKAIADRTNRKLNKVQRVLSLLIGIDEYPALGMSLKGCVYGANQIAQMLTQLNNSNPDTNQHGYVTDIAFTLYNKEATEVNIIESMRRLLTAANPEDVCLIYFSGHGENGSYNENTLITVDKSPSNSTVLNNKEVYNAIQGAKAFSPCQVVFILDSHTGYYNWVPPEDVFIGAVRHTMQREAQYDGKTVASAFLLALRDIISVTKGKITYRHLLLWLRVRIKEDYGVEDEVPVLQTIKKNLDNYFLHTDLKSSDNAPVIVFHKKTKVWRVLEEDFKICILNSDTQVRHYETNELIPEVRGELFIRDNVICFGGGTKNLNENWLYRTDCKRSELIVSLTATSFMLKEIEALSDEMDNVNFDDFSRWRKIRFLDYDITNLNMYDQILEFDVGASTCKVVFKEKMQDEIPRYSFAFTNKNLIIDFLHKFSRYYYLSNLFLNNLNNELYKPVNVTVQCRWGEDMLSDLFEQSIITINEHSLFISEGRVTVKPFTLDFKHHEEFPIFCVLYLLVSDLTIRRISSVPVTSIMPDNLISINLNETKIFENMLEKDLTVQLKLLVSRDPHLIDFTQTGLNNY